MDIGRRANLRGLNAARAGDKKHGGFRNFATPNSERGGVSTYSYLNRSVLASAGVLAVVLSLFASSNTGLASPLNAMPSNILSLDYVNDYASEPDNASLDLGVGSSEDFTIEAFFYVPDLTNTRTESLHAGTAGDEASAPSTLDPARAPALRVQENYGEMPPFFIENRG